MIREHSRQKDRESRKKKVNIYILVRPPIRRAGRGVVDEADDYLVFFFLALPVIIGCKQQAERCVFRAYMLAVYSLARLLARTTIINGVSISLSYCAAHLFLFILTHFAASSSS